MDVILLDGSEQVKETDPIAVGKVIVRTAWSENRQVKPNHPKYIFRYLLQDQIP